MYIDTGIQFRNFAAQNEFSFSVELSAESTSGVTSFGFSGQSGTQPIMGLLSGSITDFNNRHVWGYSPRDTVSISGNVGSGYINYFINNNPICLYSPKPNGIFFDYFYLSCTGASINYDLYINGTIPNYSIEFDKSINIGSKITGYIHNIESSIEKTLRLFSGRTYGGDILYAVDYLDEATVSGGSSGRIVLVPTMNPLPILLSEKDIQLSLSLNSNFGNIFKDILFTVLPAPIYYTDFLTGYTWVTGLVDNFTLGEIFNYELRSLYPRDREVSVLLSNACGNTGDPTFGVFRISGYRSGVADGFIYGRGYLTGWSTGIGISNSFNYDGIRPTGQLSSLESILQYATGDISYTYNFPLYGGSGTGASPDGTSISATGTLLPITGFIFGHGVVSDERILDLTGYYFDSINVQHINGTIDLTGYYEGISTINYLNLFWSSDNVTGVGHTGFTDKLIGIQGYNSTEITPEDLGIKIIDDTIYAEEREALMLKRRVSQNPGLFIYSGQAYSSELEGNAMSAFNGEDFFYITGPTGFLTFQFENYPESDLGKITHYSFSLDFNSSARPYEFALELSRDGMTWTEIDSRIDYDFYSPSNGVIECNAPEKIINSVFYRYARLNIISTTPWQHSFTGERSHSGIGIKNIELYSAVPVSIDGDGNYSKYSIIPDMVSYYYPGEYESIKSKRSKLGTVSCSNDIPQHPAWHATNENKNLYPYGEISSGADGKYYLLYTLSYDEIDVKPSEFYLEFEPGSEPLAYGLQISTDGQSYTTVYEKYNSTILSVESGRLNQSFSGRYFKFVFNTLDSSDLYESLYQSKAWLDSMAEESIVLSGGVISSSSSSSSSEVIDISIQSTWTTIQVDTNSEPSPSSSSSSSGVPVLSCQDIFNNSWDVEQRRSGSFLYISGLSSNTVVNLESTQSPGLDLNKSLYIDRNNGNPYFSWEGFLESNTNNITGLITGEEISLRGDFGSISGAALSGIYDYTGFISQNSEDLSQGVSGYFVCPSFIV